MDSSTGSDDKRLPAGFVEMLAATDSQLFAGLPDVLTHTEPETAIRLNLAKGAVAPPDADRVTWCDAGIYLPERPQFTFDPALHQGLYYVQDASSMGVACAVAAAVGDSDTPLRYLDACAAPGGKVLGALDVLPRGSFVVANEYARPRAAALVENLVKWGCGHVAVTCDDASRIRGLDGFFDIIAADVPCSGEGMMRKEPQAVAQWSERLVDDCAELQRAIVTNLWRALRTGGAFVYSTCTFNRRENEQVIEYMVDALGAVSCPVPALEGVADPGIATGRHCYRFIPGRIRGEGQFVALLRKPGNSPAATPRVRAQRRPDRLPPLPAWLDDTMTCEMRGDTVIARPAEQRPLYDAVDAAMHTVNPGLEVATVKGRDAVPAHALAMSLHLTDGAFPRVELDAEGALRYLERNAPALPDGSPRGYVLLTHRGRPLGFAKNLGNRANNLYPASWRILSAGRQPEKSPIP